MRSFTLTSAPIVDLSPPMPATLKLRGLCLMAIEFLTNFPAAECVVTCGAPDYWNCVYDLFPKTLFHSYMSKLEDPPRPNVIRHDSAFCWVTATKYGDRGTPFNVLFCGEDMQSQQEIYGLARPTAALLWITAPGRDYLDGELFYPLHCNQESGMCALVPAPGRPTLRDYSPYKSAVRWFQAEARRPGSWYDGDAENKILQAYVKSASGIQEAQTSALQVEVVRGSLPRRDAPDTVFYWPPELYMSHSDARPVQSCSSSQVGTIPGQVHGSEYDPEKPKELNHREEHSVQYGQHGNVELSQVIPDDLEAILRLAAGYVTTG